MPSQEPTRLEALRAMYRKDSSDGFAGYGLAMELARKPATEDEAVAVFRQVLAATPDYLPAYLQLGLLLARREEVHRAAEVYRAGIVLAARLGDIHTKGELEGALDLL